MRVIIQKVKSSQVEVAGEVIGKIDRGLNLLVGIKNTDTEVEIDWMVKKCLNLKVFGDNEDAKPWQQSVIDIQGELLVVSQFTLYSDCRKGRRPSFRDSASGEQAEELYEQFVSKLKESGLILLILRQKELEYIIYRSVNLI